MLATAHPDRDRKQFQLPTAITLLSVVCGISTSLYQKSGNTRERFIGCLVDFYPWALDPPEGVTTEEAAGILYKSFRNPLSHYLGLDHKRGFKLKVGQVLRGNGNAKSDVEKLERYVGKPYTKPSLVVTPDRQVLWVDQFYWGVRKMVEAWVRDPAQLAAAEKVFTERYAPPNAPAAPAANPTP